MPYTFLLLELQDSYALVLMKVVPVNKEQNAFNENTFLPIKI